MALTIRYDNAWYFLELLSALLMNNHLNTLTELTDYIRTLVLEKRLPTPMEKCELQEHRVA